MIRLFPWLFASLLSFRSNHGVVIGEKGILTLTPNFSLTDTVNMILFDSMLIIILFIVNIIWCDYMCWYSSDRSHFTLIFSWNNCQKMLLTFTLKLSLKEQLIKLTPSLESPLISYLNFQTSGKCNFLPHFAERELFEEIVLYFRPDWHISPAAGLTSQLLLAYT